MAKRLRLFKKFKKKSLFRKVLSLFFFALVILSIVFLIYVYKSMIIYERSLSDNYIMYLASSGKLSENVKDDLFEVSKYEKNGATITSGVKKLLKSDKLKIKKNSKESKDDIYVYELSMDDSVISKVTLKNTNNYTRMAILRIDEWNVEKIETYFENGLYHYDINIPSNYKLFVNNKEVKAEDIDSSGDVVGLERLTQYIEINKSNNYKIYNLVNKPDIKIKDESGKNVKFEIKDNKIIVEKGYTEVSDLESAKKYIKDDFDVLKLAENWSLFLTDDLAGSYHGFSQLTPYLIEDSYMYEMAYGWSHQVDITFVSSHRLKNPVFTNESVSNFVIYNENAFSCEVYLDKNMVVSGKDRVDTMHDRLYFIYYNGGYKLVNMESL